jgi:hypothetical protein
LCQWKKGEFNFNFWMWEKKKTAAMLFIAKWNHKVTLWLLSHYCAYFLHDMLNRGVFCSVSLIQFIRRRTLSDGRRQHVWTKTTRRRSFLIFLCFLLSSGSRNCHREVSYSLCLYLPTYTGFYCTSCEQKTGFVFRRSRVQISARRLAILTEVPKGVSSIHSLKWPGRRHDHFHTFPFISHWSFLY